MSDENELKADLQVIKLTLDKLEHEYNQGMIDLGRYLRLKERYEARKAKLEDELDNLARGQRTITDISPERLYLGKYEILKEIGRGGFSVVYKAWDATLERDVALKVLDLHLSREPKFVEQFHREAQTVAQLQHPHIVVIHDKGEEEGQLYIAMEYLRGYTLQTRIDKRSLSLEQVAFILEQVASALDYAHSRGVLHRDIKPGNIMLREDEQGKLHATLMDFGLVKLMRTSPYVSASKHLVGTPAYMSPEQAEGKRQDRRTDYYSLGVVTYEMCTGQRPFYARSAIALLRLHADKAPPSPRQFKPDLPVEVERVLLKALAKKKAERYQSATEMARAFRAAADKERARIEAVEQANRWVTIPLSIVWFLAGFIFIGLIELLLAQKINCFLRHKITEASVAIIIALASAIAVSFSDIAPPHVKAVLRRISGGVAVATLLYMTWWVSFSPSPSEAECFSTSTSTRLTPTITVEHTPSPATDSPTASSTRTEPAPMPTTSSPTATATALKPSSTPLTPTTPPPTVPPVTALPTGTLTPTTPPPTTAPEPNTPVPSKTPTSTEERPTYTPPPDVITTPPPTTPINTEEPTYTPPS